MMESVIIFIGCILLMLIGVAFAYYALVVLFIAVVSIAYFIASAYEKSISCIRWVEWRMKLRRMRKDK